MTASILLEIIGCFRFNVPVIHRGLNFKLLPQKEQEARLEQASGVNRLIYNLALEQRRDWRDHYQRNTGRGLNWVAQSRELTSLRHEFDFIRQESQSSQQRELSNLQAAFERFWRQGGGFPKFRKKGQGDRFFAEGRDIKVESLNNKYSRVRLPKIGWIKFRRTREIEGKVCRATVTRAGPGWAISFACEIGRDVPDVGGAVGLDRGVSIPVMCSDGMAFAMPETARHLERMLRKAQRIVSRRKRGSKRRAKALARVQNVAAKRVRIRKEWAHRLTTAITRKYGTIVIESLRVKHMVKSSKGTIEKPGKNVSQKRGLNRSILNVGWHQIETMLAYKAHRLIKINPAYSSQTCSSCGTVDSKSRKSQASFVCASCGYRDNADRNAASVILQRGNTALLDVEGCDCAPDEASTSGQPLTMAI